MKTGKGDKIEEKIDIEKQKLKHIYVESAIVTKSDLMLTGPQPLVVYLCLKMIFLKRLYIS